MCLAIPGRVQSVDGRKAMIEYPGQVRPAMVADVDVLAGDWVRVQMGIVIEKVSEEEARVAGESWS